MSMPRFQGKIAMVTGGASGIGRAIACALAAEGAGVVVADRDAGTARSVSREIGASCDFAELDVTETASWTDALRRLDQGFGRLDILVNNAGVVLLEAIEDMTLVQWRTVIETNMDGAFLGMQHCAPRIRAGGGGAIINIASTAGLRGAAYASAYSASKAGLISLTRSAARQFARDEFGVRVNAICPGPVATPAHIDRPGALARRLGREAIEQQIVASVPMGRLGRPEEIASAALFLASSEASFITGAVLTADGGQAA
jgi:NAD(P)-dependent dehydrogenase (short-subunit alcohol dehydrogenase family)